MISQSLFNPLFQAYTNSSNALRSPLDSFNMNPFSADAQDFFCNSQLSKRANPYAEYEVKALSSNIQKKLKTQNDDWSTPLVNNTARIFPEKTINIAGNTANRQVINLEDDSDDECIIIEKSDSQKKAVSEPLVVKDNFLNQINPMFNNNNFAINSIHPQFMNQITNSQRTQYSLTNKIFESNPYTPDSDMQNKKPISSVIIIDEDDQDDQEDNKNRILSNKQSDSIGFSDCQTDSTLTPNRGKSETSDNNSFANIKFQKSLEDSETESITFYTPGEEAQEAVIPALCMTRPAKGTGRRAPKQVWNPNTVERNTLEQYYIDLSKLTRKDITNEEVAINTLKMCEMDVSKTLVVVKQNRAIYRDLFSTKKKINAH